MASLFRLPLDILLQILEWDIQGQPGLDAFSVLASSCKTFSCSHYDDFWLMMYNKATGNSFRGQRSRSSACPRIAFFRAVYLSLQRIRTRVDSMRNLINRKDSPAEVLKQVVSGESTRYWVTKIKDRGLQPIVGELMLYAAYLQRWNTVRALIVKAGAPINFRGSANGETLLIVAAWSGNHKVCEWILSNKGTVVDVEASAKLQQTSFCGGVGPYSALVWAQRKAALAGGPGSAHHKCVALLLRAERKQEACSLEGPL